MYYKDEETSKEFKANKFSRMCKQARERLNKIRDLKKLKKQSVK